MADAPVPTKQLLVVGPAAAGKDWLVAQIQKALSPLGRSVAAVTVRSDQDVPAGEFAGVIVVQTEPPTSHCYDNDLIKFNPAGAPHLCVVNHYNCGKRADYTSRIEERGLFFQQIPTAGAGRRDWTSGEVIPLCVAYIVGYFGLDR